MSLYYYTNVIISLFWQSHIQSPSFKAIKSMMPLQTLGFSTSFEIRKSLSLNALFCLQCETFGHLYLTVLEPPRGIVFCSSCLVLGVHSNLKRSICCLFQISHLSESWAKMGFQRHLTQQHKFCWTVPGFAPLNSLDIFENSILCTEKEFGIVDLFLGENIEWNRKVFTFL